MKTHIDWIRLEIDKYDIKVYFYRIGNAYKLNSPHHCRPYYLRSKSASLSRLYNNLNNREDFDVAFYDNFVEIDFYKKEN